MEIFRFNILPMDDIEKREAFKEAINNCPICGVNMEFKYDYDFVINKVKEECRCPSCTIQIRSEIFELQ